MSEPPRDYRNGNFDPTNPRPYYNNGLNQHNQPPFQQLSPAMLQALQECRTEAFWYRSLPLGILSSGFVWYRHSIEPKTPWGIAGRLIGSFIGSMIIGTGLYLGKCREKFEKIPLSERYNPEFAMSPPNYNQFPPSAYPKQPFQPPQPFQLPQALKPPDSYDMWSPNSSFDQPSSTPIWDDQFPKSDNRVAPNKDDYNNPSRNNNYKHYNSYSELRERARQEYEMKQRQGAQPQPGNAYYPPNGQQIPAYPPNLPSFDNNNRPPSSQAGEKPPSKYDL